MKRKLLDGTEVDNFDIPVDLIIHTKAPSKWKIIDMETGEEYIGSSEKNNIFAPMLMERVARGVIGQWKKIKRKNDK